MGWIETYKNDSEYASIVTRDSTLDSKDCTIGTGWHTYRFEVRNEQLIFSIDGSQTVPTTDTTYLSAGRVGLVVMGDTQINVRSFQVTPL